MSKSNDNMKLADEARDLFNKREFKECIQCLDKLNNPKLTQANKLIASYLIDNDAKAYLDNLDQHSKDYKNELTFNQQSINDYNKALIFCKKEFNFKKSIDILEIRIGLIEQNHNQLIDQSVFIKIFILLVTIYMERKERIERALSLLDALSEKLADDSQLPKNFYYLKVRCYLANSDFVNFRNYMHKLTNNEQFMISCYLESLGGVEQSISKLSTFNSLNNVNLKNNEALAKYSNDKVLALNDLSKIYNTLTPEVLYNFGLMHLNTGNIENALLIFKNLIKDFKFNPRLWSRISDCYLLKFKSSRPNSLKCNVEQVTKFIGDNLQRKLILKPTILTVQDEEQLKSARRCLLNSLVLLTSADSSFYPSNEPTDNELKQYKLSVLLKLAFVNLNLFDYVNANRYADLCLKGNPNGLLHILITLYKFESLIWLDQIDEAENLIKKLELQFTQELINEDYDDYINQNRRLNYIEWDKKFLKYIVLHSVATCLAIKQNLPELQKYLADASTEAKKSLQDGLTYIILLSIYKYVVSN